MYIRSNEAATAVHAICKRLTFRLAQF